MIGILLGTPLATAVTVHLHLTHGFWGARLGTSRFRRANLPVGGILALTIGLVGGPSAEDWFGAAGVMTAIAIGWRYVDPLPPVPA